MLAIADESQFIAQLRSGDEDAFLTLVETHHAGLMRMAMVFTASESVAEELVQETWLAVIDGIQRFEGRSSVKTWIFAIMANKAKRRAGRDARMINLSSMEKGRNSLEELLYKDNGHWRQRPKAWAVDPEERLVRGRMLEQVKICIETLPPKQRLVVTMRDVQGFSTEEICEVLGVSHGHQRVILSRARSAIRAHLERTVFAEEDRGQSSKGAAHAHVP